MKKKEVILYKYKGKNSLYINLTNRCTNQCVFCIRNLGLREELSLWLKKEPSSQIVIKKLNRCLKKQNFSEICFCGFGEPLLELKKVIRICRYLKKNFPQIKIRINTNGLANLYYQRDITFLLRGLVDCLSISLNAHSAVVYDSICRPVFGKKSFASLLRFIREARKNIPLVQATIVCWPGVDIEKCKKISQKFGVELKIREFRNQGNYYQSV